jgi:hypothetical protein
MLLISKTHCGLNKAVNIPKNKQGVILNALISLAPILEAQHHKRICRRNSSSFHLPLFNDLTIIAFHCKFINIKNVK